ncbi:hypothetical protein EVAR_675_1 [Eumeta japonica]|uniref:Uncharacterized protein n=1 Tax=Eumeta variegata TaxID=151549 RepID=A0A4C1SBR8_EUMVA|nr:hypothetical protein EVAR_675_1 [Eumeta japonica]
MPRPRVPVRTSIPVVTDKNITAVPVPSVARSSLQRVSDLWRAPDRVAAVQYADVVIYMTACETALRYAAVCRTRADVALAVELLVGLWADGESHILTIHRTGRPATSAVPSLRTLIELMLIFRDRGALCLGAREGHYCRSIEVDAKRLRFVSLSLAAAVLLIFVARSARPGRDDAEAAGAYEFNGFQVSISNARLLNIVAYLQTFLFEPRAVRGERRKAGIGTEGEIELTTESESDIGTCRIRDGNREKNRDRKRDCDRHRNCEQRSGVSDTDTAILRPNKPIKVSRRNIDLSCIGGAYK